MLSLSRYISFVVSLQPFPTRLFPFQDNRSPRPAKHYHIVYIRQCKRSTRSPSRRKISDLSSEYTSKEMHARRPDGREGRPSAPEVPSLVTATCTPSRLPRTLFSRPASIHVKSVPHPTLQLNLHC